MNLDWPKDHIPEAVWIRRTRRLPQRGCIILGRYCELAPPIGVTYDYAIMSWEGKVKGWRMQVGKHSTIRVSAPDDWIYLNPAL